MAPNAMAKTTLSGNERSTTSARAPYGLSLRPTWKKRKAAAVSSSSQGVRWLEYSSRFSRVRKGSASAWRGASTASSVAGPPSVVRMSRSAPHLAAR